MKLKFSNRLMRRVRTLNPYLMLDAGPSYVILDIDEKIKEEPPSFYTGEIVRTIRPGYYSRSDEFCFEISRALADMYTDSEDAGIRVIARFDNDGYLYIPADTSLSQVSYSFSPRLSLQLGLPQPGPTTLLTSCEVNDPLICPLASPLHCFCT